MLYAGSIACCVTVPGCRPQGLGDAAARCVSSTPTCGPTLLPDGAAVTKLQELVEEFFATADLVKLSSADAEVLYDGADPAAAAERIRGLGAGAVVVTCGSKGAFVAAGGRLGDAARAERGRDRRDRRR